MSFVPSRFADGWQRRFVAGPARAAEMIDLYRALGFEVEADPVGPTGESEGCRDCWQIATQRLMVIYTRRPPGSGPPGTPPETR